MTIANVEMAKAWDGEEGEEWAADARHYEATGQAYTRRLLAAAAIASGERVLDVGCGNGGSTRLAARAAAPGAVTGIDLSGPMLEVARDRSKEEGIDNVDFVKGDVQVHPFAPSTFDVAISSFGAMFFEDPVAAFANVGRALRPGGRLAFHAWQELARNEWLVAIRGALAAGRDLPAPPTGAPGPFGLADPETSRALFEAAGFTDVSFEAVEEPLTWGDDADDAFAFLSRLSIVRWLSSGLDEATSEQVRDNLRRLVEDHAGPNGVTMAGAAWLITATRP